MMQSWSSIALPALFVSSGVIPVLPWFPTWLREPSSKFKQKEPLVELWAKLCCFSLFLPPLHPLPGGLHLKLSPPTSFLTSWSLVFFLTAVQPLLSDGLFCCLKHLIGGQVYIIRGESQSLPPREVLPCQRFPTFACYPDGWTQQSNWSTWRQNY